MRGCCLFADQYFADWHSTDLHLTAQVLLHIQNKQNAAAVKGEFVTGFGEFSLPYSHSKTIALNQ